MPITSADIRNASLLSVATVAAGFLVPNGGIVVFALPLSAFALGWLTYRFGHIPAMLLAVATGGVVALFGPSLIGTSVLDGVFVAVALLAIGPATAIALRRYPALNVAAVVAVAITLAFLVAPIGALTLKESVGVWRELLAALAVSGKVSDPVALKATTTAWLAQMSLAWPATSFYTMGIGTAAGVALVSRAGRSLGQEVHRYGALADMDVSFHVVWPTIIGLACAAAGSLWSQSPEVLGAVGTNLLMFVRPFLFLQGAAVFAALYQKMGAGRLMKIIGFVLLALMDTFVPSVSVLGIADVFANLRKLPRAGGGAPQATV